MLIADTSIWIEFLKGKKEYLPLALLIEERVVFAVECIFGELLQGSRSERERKIILAYWENLPKVEESGIWLAAGRKSSEEKLFPKGIGLVDLAILVSAQSRSLKIWTLDKKLLSILKPSEIWL